MNQLSICIPRVDSSTTKEHVKNVFNNVLSPGQDVVTSVDFVTKHNERDEQYKRVFIHFVPWDTIDNPTAQEIHAKLASGTTIKIMHKEPYYWKCSMNRLQRPHWLSEANQDSNNDSQQS
jgi:hypothetical protein